MIHTLKLLQHPSIVDAWHDVTAPGGYEWWYFDAEDVECDRQIVAILFEGCALHPEYLRRYAAYERDPTRVAPPVPREYICAYFAVYHAGKIEHQFMTQYPYEQFEARHDEPHVQIGPNRFTADDDVLKLWLGGTPWKHSMHRAKLLPATQLTASLSFKPRFAHGHGERELFSRQLAGAEHRWIIADPLCDVEGEITVPTGSATTTIPFRGRGYHDHNFGTGPIGPGIRQWFSGRVLLDDRCATFHFARPRDWTIEPEAHLIEIDSTGAREFDLDVERIEISWSKKSKTWLRYPPQANFQDQLRLENPRLIDSSPFHLRLMYDANLRGTKAKASCHIAYPHRLRVPVLGRLIEMAIDKRAMSPR